MKTLILLYILLNINIKQKQVKIHFVKQDYSMKLTKCDGG